MDVPSRTFEYCIGLYGHGSSLRPYCLSYKSTTTGRSSAILGAARPLKLTRWLKYLLIVEPLNDRSTLWIRSAVQVYP